MGPPNSSYEGLLMSQYEITLKNGTVEVVEGADYFCDPDLISVIRNEKKVATFHGWDSIRIVDEER